MSAQGVVARDSQKDLIAVLDSGQLEEGPAKHAKDILARLQKPLRLSVLGLPGSGKSMFKCSATPSLKPSVSH